MVRDILETRAEIYRALNQTPRSESEEEEGPSQTDVQLEEHLKLKESMAENTGNLFRKRFVNTYHEKNLNVLDAQQNLTTQETQ